MHSVMPESKICTKCGKNLLLKKFYEDWNGKYGRGSKCISCCALYYIEKKQTDKLKAVNA